MMTRMKRREAEHKKYTALLGAFKALPDPARYYWTAAAECMNARFFMAELREGVEWEAIHGVAASGSGKVVPKEAARKMLKKWRILERLLEERCQHKEQYFAERCDGMLILDRSLESR